MKKIIFAAVFIFLGIANTAIAQSTPNCNQGENLAQKTWEKWGPWKPDILPIPFRHEVITLRNHWNWIVNNSGATVGPRRLEIDGGNETGNILGQTKSTFVTPPSFENKVVITINKYDGRAETGVTICTHGRDGVTTTVTSYVFPNDNNGKVKTFTVNNAKGKIISVAMKNNSVGNKFSYRINAK